MSTTVAQLVKWLNAEYPRRDWNQQCQRLVWNAVAKLSGTPDNEMVTYPTATAARHASTIVSTDAGAAPAGAIHYWRNPAEGHVGIALGNGLVLMTGTPRALGNGSVQYGNNYGMTSVERYTRTMGNPYLGWAYRNGRNPSILEAFAPKPAPTPVPQRKVKTMLGLRITDGKGRYGAKGKRYFATFDGYAFVHLNEGDANAVSVHLGESFANVTYTAWEAYQKAATVEVALPA